MASSFDKNLLLLAISVQLLFYLSGALAALILPNRQRGLSYALLFSGLAGVVAVICGIYFVASKSSTTVCVFHSLLNCNDAPATYQFNLEFYADRLTGFFLILTGGLNIAAVLHMAGWLPGQHDRNRIASTYNLFMLFILLALAANTVYFYILFLEGITLTFAYLALYRHNLAIENGPVPTYTPGAPGAGSMVESAKAAFKVYLIFEHVGMMCLTTALLILSSNGFSFNQFRLLSRAGGELSDSTARLAFLLALIGLGIKAGIFPAHVWVPMVHPYSPTSIHAIMSGIVLKVAGIYGMYRFFFEFLLVNEWWWGVVVLLLAGATTLAGVFYALLMRDLKPALASHSVENVGIILIGIGLALIYRWAARQAAEHDLEIAARALSGLAGLALTASLFHLLNHSIFKSLLFFCTGAIENRMGTTSLDRLGGLMNRYPWTSVTFLVGAISIAGLPPFNGFASEWLILQVLFAGVDLFSLGMSGQIFILLGMVLVLLCLAIAIGLTAIAFVKIAGETLLGMPRDTLLAQQARPGDVPWSIRSVLVSLAALCLFLGIFASPVVRELRVITAGFTDDTAAEILNNGLSLTLQIPLFRSDILVGENEDFVGKDPLVFTDLGDHYIARVSFRFIVILAIMLGTVVMSVILGRPRKLFGWLRSRFGPVWTGGERYDPETMQYTGSAFTSLIWLPFENRYNRDENRTVEKTEEAMPFRIFVTQTHFVIDVFRRSYNQAICRLLNYSQQLGEWIQNGDIRRYFSYIFSIFILALVILLFLVSSRR